MTKQSNIFVLVLAALLLTACSPGQDQDQADMPNPPASSTAITTPPPQITFTPAQKPTETTTSTPLPSATPTMSCTGMYDHSVYLDNQPAFSIRQGPGCEYQEFQGENPMAFFKVLGKYGDWLAIDLCNDQPGWVFAPAIAWLNLNGEIDDLPVLTPELAAIPPATTLPEMDSRAAIETARDTLVAFFDHLYDKNYEAAVQLFGGGYGILVMWNDAIDPNDHAALMMRGCEWNGFQCFLRVSKIISAEQISPLEFHFKVEFILPDGKLYQRIGANDTPISQFTFRVARDCRGNFFVVDWPFYEQYLQSCDPIPLKQVYNPEALYNYYMSLIQTTAPLVRLQLARKLTRQIKRGHAWVYADALRNLPQAAPGSPAILLDNKGGREIARGYYDPASPIALRVCSTQPGQELNEDWAAARMGQALSLRQTLFDPNITNGYRLFNGEGDGLPGLVCDIYNDHAALKTDGEGAAAFWDLAGIAAWLHDHLGISNVYAQTQRRGEQTGQVVLGELPNQPVEFLENGVQFTADLVRGQKTGFFLDQRDNRACIRQLAGEARVLNMFGYTGGFSVYAGLGGAVYVTTVDQAAPALAAAAQHWARNGLPAALHTSAAADAIEFFKTARQDWDIVILDPPSFASSEQAVPAAEKAYTRLIAAGADVTAPSGILAAASCSSHIRQADFLTICQEAVSQARRTATLLGVYGQPPDHPAPLVMEELRYLKFVLMRLG